MGLDWAAIRAEYERKASPEELEGRIPDADADKPVAPRRRVRRGPDKYGDGSGSTVSRSRIIELYNQPMKVREIAEHLGIHPSGVYKHLEAAAERGQVRLRDDRKLLPGRPRRDRCVKDLHPLTEGHPNVRVDRNGARHCRACESARRGGEPESAGAAVS